MSIAYLFSLAQRRGFAPLAARPARQLSIAAFAVDCYGIYAYTGKAFCSRKTAPTLKSSSKFETQNKKRYARCISFFVGAEKRI
jgi:hypothetical protein